MKITVRLPISKGKKNDSATENAHGYERSFSGHKSHNSLEKENTPYSASTSHKKESDDVGDDVSNSGRRNSFDLSISAVQALMQLVEHYNDTLKEIAAFSKNRRLAAHQPTAQAVPPPINSDEVKSLMIAGTGDPLEANALKRRQLMIAESPAATPDILLELVNSHFIEVREAIADHVSCPESLLLFLSEDDSPEVRYALAENHRLSFSILEKLTHDDNPYVSVRAQRTMRRVLSNNVVTIDKRSDRDDEMGDSILAKA